MNEIFSGAAWETLCYFFLGGLSTAAVAALFLGLLWSCELAGAIDANKASVLTKRFLVFAAALFVFGAPANIAFTLGLRGRLYVPDDPFVDFLPWLPASGSALGLGSQGHYLGEASAMALNGWWLVLAIPVWGFTLLTYRRLLEREWQW
jgi:hypothetical protein